jgi:ADP-ribosylglycohydrolase
MTDPITLTMIAVALVKKYLMHKAIDYAMLQRFKDEYQRLPDKRRRPGPKLRRIIQLMEDGASGGMIREEIKELYDEVSDSPDLSDLVGQLF